MAYFVYILANRQHGTQYTGVTNDRARRAWEHREKHNSGFTSRYGVSRLVYYETHEDVSAAIHREKRIKKWSRAMKIRMIETMNPDWEDLYDTLNT
ncbi:GIY-YIG nuclease family protein [Roseibium sp.]|uniref:GIY-YIG nuclease family protein n=1 Tax=Roseibium sp. TaxID=1936156 RepID=UPI003A9706F9